MKYLLIISLMFPGFIYSQSWNDFKKAAKKVNAELNSKSKNGNIFSKNAPQCLLRYGRQRRAPGRRVIAEAIDSTMGA